MREFDDSPPALAGSLLIAHPNLLDPNFRRTVLLIAANDSDEGSFGFVLNRPTGKTVRDFIDADELGPLSDLPVYIGGPVGVEQLTFASIAWTGAEEGIECDPNLSIEDAREMAIVRAGELRAFIGYAGWGKGQLEAELAQKAWMLQRAEEQFLAAHEAEEMWRASLRKIGPWFRLLAAAPDDPSRN
ncbi:MAG: YqgE/AlgH family protein [Verrucomicrobiota bacterium]|nr:YqgE/AlgH family protein [Verrucomicrobiota bacterium]